MVSLLLLCLSTAANFVDREGYLGTGGPGKADEVLDCVTANIHHDLRSRVIFQFAAPLELRPLSPTTLTQGNNSLDISV